MKKVMCVGFGLVLICTACVLYFSENVANDAGLRVVGDAEASLVLGGGAGAIYAAGECGKGVGTCSGSGYVGQGGVGSNVPRPNTTHSCGGSCGNYHDSIDPTE